MKSAAAGHSEYINFDAYDLSLDDGNESDNTICDHEIKSGKSDGSGHVSYKSEILSVHSNDTTHTNSSKISIDQSASSMGDPTVLQVVATNRTASPRPNVEDPEVTQISTDLSSSSLYSSNYDLAELPATPFMTRVNTVRKMALQNQRSQDTSIFESSTSNSSR